MRARRLYSAIPCSRNGRTVSRCHALNFLFPSTCLHLHIFRVIMLGRKLSWIWTVVTQKRETPHYSPSPVSLYADYVLTAKRIKAPIPNSSNGSSVSWCFWAFWTVWHSAYYQESVVMFGETWVERKSCAIYSEKREAHFQDPLRWMLYLWKWSSFED